MPRLSPPTSKRSGSQFESMNLAIILHIVVQSVALRNRLALRRLDRGCWMPTYKERQKLKMTFSHNFKQLSIWTES